MATSTQVSRDAESIVSAWEKEREHNPSKFRPAAVGSKRSTDGAALWVEATELHGRLKGIVDRLHRLI